jgi:TPR repeat protein
MRLAACLIVTLLALAPWPLLAAPDKGKTAAPTAAPGADRQPSYNEVLARAQKGDPTAQNTLGVMLATGSGVAQDYKEAAKWYDKAAQQGVAIAQANLGHLYEQGWGVPRDNGAAAVWYRLAAEQGDDWSQLSLGQMIANNKVENPDLVMGYMWLSLATRSKEPSVKKQAGDAMKALRPRLKPAQVNEAEAMAKNFRPTMR